MQFLKSRIALAGAVAAAFMAGVAFLPSPRAHAGTSPLQIRLPLEPKSVRFAVIGDNGTGEEPEYQVARQMEIARQTVQFDFVVMLGDNIYGHKQASDLRKKFEDPYEPLTRAGVKFYASLGNHDHPDERFYKPFNMGGQRYYAYTRGNVQFFALDSSYMDPDQLSWIAGQLATSSAAWKICYFHHPLYSDGKFHGSDLDLRAHLEPIFMTYGVNVVLNGHEHVYERLVPQHDIYYFVLGNSGELRPHNLRPSPTMAKGFDTDRAFALFEIAGDELYFQVVSGAGDTIDSGSLARQARKVESPSR